MARTLKKVNGNDISANEETVDVSDHNARIAVLAFYKAEKRGFQPGHELQDWFEAEQEWLLRNYEA
jgi:hypothetical protein